MNLHPENTVGASWSLSKLPCVASSHQISKTHSKFLPENLYMLALISCVAVGGDLERSPKEHYNFEDFHSEFFSLFHTFFNPFKRISQEPACEAHGIWALWLLVSLTQASLTREHLSKHGNPSEVLWLLRLILKWIFELAHDVCGPHRGLWDALQCVCTCVMLNCMCAFVVYFSHEFSSCCVDFG